MKITDVHQHRWEKGAHMKALGVDGRRYACAVCGLLQGAWETPVQSFGPGCRAVAWPNLVCRLPAAHSGSHVARYPVEDAADWTLVVAV